MASNHTFPEVGFQSSMSRNWFQEQDSIIMSKMHKNASIHMNQPSILSILSAAPADFTFAPPLNVSAKSMDVKRQWMFWHRRDPTIKGICWSNPCLSWVVHNFKIGAKFYIDTVGGCCWLLVFIVTGSQPLLIIVENERYWYVLTNWHGFQCSTAIMCKSRIHHIKTYSPLVLFLW